ncbi:MULTISPECIES: DUF6221 family protein [unclassified Streptomyces]|uniref:DUF6221 family protein n=1 Tax=unclassified Streptomyces TaxID=2593676 RepID=UPI002E2E780B|nr:DUF6221 family protein [Streptomyces sp. NBC_00223]
MKNEVVAAEVAAFLRARLDEDEADARAATPGAWSADDSDYAGAIRSCGGADVIAGGRRGGDASVSESTEDAPRIARYDPARVLRDVEATRGVLAMYDQMVVDMAAPDAATSGPGRIAVTVLTPVLCHLARAYSDHPDHRADEWAPII